MLTIQHRIVVRPEIALVVFFFSDPDRSHVSIHALDSSAREDTYDFPVSVFPPNRVRLCQGERADYLSEFTRAVGGEIMLDRQRHTTGAQLFAGTKARRMHACTFLFDTGSPASFIQEKVWSRMLARSAASQDGSKKINAKTWGGFHGIPLVTSKRVRFNIQLGSSEKKSRGVVRSPAVCLVVHAYIVPDKAMSTSVLLGRDIWSFFLSEHTEI